MAEKRYGILIANSLLGLNMVLYHAGQAKA